jgi:hypothetical protein
MARDITVTFEDGTVHVYRGAPDDITPDQVQTRAQKDFNKTVKAMDGGRAPSVPAAPPGQIPGPGTLVAPPPAPEGIPFGRQVAQTLGNIVAGGVRGAASIGSTLTELARTGPAGLGGQPVQTIIPRIQGRGDEVSSFLQGLGAEPESIAFKGGKLGGEIAGTLGVGPALAAGARAAGATAPVVAGLQSGGLARTGAPTLPSGAVARVGGGAAAGGVSAGIVSPQDALTGATIGAALPAVVGPAGAVIGGVYRSAIEPLIKPGIVAENQLLGALGGQSQEAINALRATEQLQTTPGFRPTMTERLIEGGVREPVAAAMEAGLAGGSPELNRRVLAFAEQRVGALQGQLNRVNQVLQRQVNMLQPQARISLEGMRSSLMREMQRAQQEVQTAQQALAGNLADVSQLEVGGRLSAAAQKELEAAREVVSKQYNQAFQLAGAEPAIPFAGVVERAGILREQPIQELKGLAPETAKILQLYAPRAAEPVPVGAGKVTSRMMQRAPEALPPMVTLEQASALGKALNIDYAALKGSTDAASNIARGNINRLRTELDAAIAKSGLSDEAKDAYKAAKQAHATQVAERFYTGTASKMFREGASNVALLGDEAMAKTVLGSETGARDILAAVGQSPETRQALVQGVEDLFRRATVDPATKAINPQSAAKFLQDNARQIDAIGGGLRQRLEQVQQSATALSDAATNLRDASGKVVGRSARELVDFALQNKRNLETVRGQMGWLAKEAMTAEFAARAAAGIKAGRPEDSLAFLNKHADTLRETLGKGTYDQMIRQASFAQEVAKQSDALKKFGKDVEGVLFTRTQNFTAQQLSDLSLVAKDLERAERAAGAARQGQKTLLDVGELATEAARQNGGSARQLPQLLNRAMTVARNTWIRLEDRINRKAAGELYALMIENPTAAIAALERAQLRASGTGVAQQGARLTGRALGQAAILEPAMPINALMPQTEKRNNLAQ